MAGKARTRRRKGKKLMELVGDGMAHAAAETQMGDCFQKQKQDSRTRGGACAEYWKRSEGFQPAAECMIESEATWHKGPPNCKRSAKSEFAFPRSHSSLSISLSILFSLFARF